MAGRGAVTGRARSGRRLLGASFLIVAATLATLSYAQDELIQPPRIEDGADEPPAADEPARPGDAGGPGEARLAPPAENRQPVLEEVIVVNESEWRLPDLGSAWRQAQEDAVQHGRIEASFLPLYDPEHADPNVDLFPRDREMDRVGFIEIFRVRFGRRSRD